MPEKQSRADMKLELACLLAQMCAEDGEEVYLETFTNEHISILPASVVMEVKVFMRHKNKTALPHFDLAGVIGYAV